MVSPPWKKSRGPGRYSTNTHDEYTGSSGKTGGVPQMREVRKGSRGMESNSRIYFLDEWALARWGAFQGEGVRGMVQR